MNSTILPAGEAQAGEPPAALLSEVTQHLDMVSEHADEVTIALLGSVASGEATWCAGKHTYQRTSVPPPPHDLQEHKGRKGRRKQRREPKQEL